jgi:hypothetical protein
MDMDIEKDVMTAKERYDSCFYRVSYDEDAQQLVLTSVSGDITRINIGVGNNIKSCKIRTENVHNNKVAVPEATKIDVKNVFVNGIKNYVDECFDVDCNTITFNYLLPAHAFVEIEYTVQEE